MIGSVRLMGLIMGSAGHASLAVYSRVRLLYCACLIFGLPDHMQFPRRLDAFFCFLFLCAPIFSSSRNYFSALV